MFIKLDSGERGNTCSSCRDRLADKVHLREHTGAVHAASENERGFFRARKVGEMMVEVICCSPVSGSRP